MDKIAQASIGHDAPKSCGDGTFSGHWRLHGDRSAADRSCGYAAHLLTRALERSTATTRSSSAVRGGEQDLQSIKRGVGFAAFMHGTGFTGSGERRLNSLVHLDVLEDGRPQILVSSTEFGQGTNTILCQVAAQTLGAFRMKKILIAQSGHECCAELRTYGGEPNGDDRRQARRAHVRNQLLQTAA